MTLLQGYSRTDRRPGARNHVFVLPSVVCSTRLSREIADATGAITVAHQHGCGHIGPDIVQTRHLFAGLALNPNVFQSVVASLGCETVQGKHVVAELARREHPVPLITIQDLGGYDGALRAGVTEAGALVEAARGQGRRDVAVDQLVLAITAARRDPRIAALVELASEAGITVVVAGHGAHADQTRVTAATISVGEQPARGVSFVERAGSGAQLLASTAACGAQVIVDFPAENQPPQGFPLVPVISVGAGAELHALIADDLDLPATADPQSILDRVGEVFSGQPTKAEERGSASFAIPRLLRTM